MTEGTTNLDDCRNFPIVVSSFRLVKSKILRIMASLSLDIVILCNSQQRFQFLNLISNCSLWWAATSMFNSLLKYFKERSYTTWKHGRSQDFFRGDTFWKFFKKFLQKIAKNSLFKHMKRWENFRKFKKFLKKIAENALI